MLHPEEIIELSEYLKRQEFQSSPYQIFSAQQVLFSEAAWNSGAGSLARLSTLLGPIFCRTPEEQHKFEELYLQWLRQRSGRPNTIPSTPTGPGPGPEIPTSHWRMKVLGIALLILPILTAWFLWQDLRLRYLIGHVMAEGTPVSQATVRLGEQTDITNKNGKFQFPFQAKDMPMELGVEKEEFLPSLTPIGPEIKANRNWFYLHPFDRSIQFDIGEIVLSKEEQPPVPPKPPITESDQLPPAKLSLEKIATLKSPVPPWWARLDYEILGKVLAPVLLAVGWLLYRLTRLRGLQRQSSRIPPELKHVPVQAGTQHIFPSLSLRHITQRLRQTRLVESTELDVHRTIQCTLERGGLFTPVYGSKHEPGYVALIDRSTLADHQAHMAAQLVKDLARGYVLVRQYEFDEQPLMLRRVDPLRPSPKHGVGGAALATAVEVVPLEEVQAKFPARRLLCFVDPISCFDPLTGKLRPWVETLEAWEERFLLCPTPDGHWGQAERILSRRGFQVIPLSLLGLRLLSTLLEQGSSGAQQKRVVPGASSFHDRMPERWLERHPPSEEFIHRLLGDLEKDFSQEQGAVNAERGKQGMRWLAACAAYPEIHWALTLEWGVRLFGHGPTAEALLPKLTRLIWFRQAFMPDWFRKVLYDRLTASEADRISQELSEILTAVNPESGERLQLYIATQPGEKPEPASPVGPIRASFRRLGRKLRLQAMGKAAEPGSPMGDYVMLQYLSGKQGKKALTPYAPKALLRVLFPKGQPWLGFRPAFLMVAAVLASGGLWWWLDPVPKPLPSPIQQVGFLPGTNEVILKRESARIERWGQVGKKLNLLESGEEDAFKDRLSQTKMEQFKVSDPTGMFDLAYKTEGEISLIVHGDGRELAQESAPPSPVASLHWPKDSEAFLVVAPTEVPELVTINGLDGLRQQELARRNEEKKIAEAKAKEKAAAKAKAREKAAKLAEAKRRAELAAKEKAAAKAKAKEEATKIAQTKRKTELAANEKASAEVQQMALEKKQQQKVEAQQTQSSVSNETKTIPCEMPGNNRPGGESDLLYQNRETYFEGIKPPPVSGFDIELLSFIADYKDQVSSLPECFRLRFFLSKESPVNLIVRSLGSDQNYVLDKVIPSRSWGTEGWNVFEWPTQLVIQRIKPKVNLYDLGALVRLDSESPSSVERIAPAILYHSRLPSKISGYSVVLKTSEEARIVVSIRHTSTGKEMEKQTFRRTPGRHFSIQWEVAEWPAGIYRIGINGFLLKANSSIKQEIEFYHQPLLRPQPSSVDRQQKVSPKTEETQLQQTEKKSGKLPQQITGKDGAPMVLVPAGEFTMGARKDDKDAQIDERPAHPVYLDAFYIDQYEVTTTRYAEFFQETKRAPPRFWSETVLKEHGKKPVVGVTWEDANAYCIWAGKKLPTEAQWEKAARRTDQRLYPWGNEPPNEQLANFNKCCDFKDYGALTDVGSFERGKSPYGAYDMAGNVWEWVADWYDGNLYNNRANPKGEPPRNPHGPEKGEFRVVRGGSWGNGARFLRSTNRDDSTPSYWNYILFGLRCAQGAP